MCVCMCLSGRPRLIYAGGPRGGITDTEANAEPTSAHRIEIPHHQRAGEGGARVSERERERERGRERGWQSEGSVERGRKREREREGESEAGK